jgi:hypothetical protein
MGVAVRASSTIEDLPDKVREKRLSNVVFIMERRVHTVCLSRFGNVVSA